MKKLLILIVVVSFSLIAIGTIIFFKREKDPDEGKIIYTNTFNNFFNIMYEYGYPILDEKKYETYPKMDEMYFISLRQLEKDFGYDISKFVDQDGNSCNVDTSGIYFDIDGISAEIDRGPYYPIIPTFSGCGVNPNGKK